jgi:tyrosyl-tRNA synthetase
VPTAEIKEILGEKNPRDAKMRLAYEIVKINYGENGASEAQNNFVKIVQNKEIPEEIEERKVDFDKLGIIDLLILLELAPSKTEARRLIEQGGIKIGLTDNLEVVSDPKENVLIQQGLIVSRGKRQFVKITK